MPEVAVKDIKNQSAGTLSLREEVFGLTGREALLHEAVVNYLANQRQGTHATKTKGKVRGGGCKPYKQKGTGRARAGSNRSPLWKGGGTTFGPQPRDYYYRMPKKARRVALYAALSMKLADAEVVVVDGMALPEPRTRGMVEVINGLGLGGGSLLVVLKETERNVTLSARNIPGVRLKLAGDLHAYDVLSHRRLLVTKDALESLGGGVD